MKEFDIKLKIKQLCLLDYILTKFKAQVQEDIEKYVGYTYIVDGFTDTLAILDPILEQVEKAIDSDMP